VRVFVFGVEADRAFIEASTRVLRSDGHEVAVLVMEQFPIADPLAALVASAARYDRGVAVVGHDAYRDGWVVAEIANESETTSRSRFAVVGAPAGAKA
jgi:hypothetical protein